MLHENSTNNTKIISLNNLIKHNPQIPIKMINNVNHTIPDLYQSFSAL